MRLLKSMLMYSLLFSASMIAQDYFSEDVSQPELKDGFLEDRSGNLSFEQIEILDYLTDKGYDPDQLHFDGGEVVYEGDMRLSVVALNLEMKLEKCQGDILKQRKHDNLVTDVENLKVKFDWDVPSRWREATETAINAFNSLEGSSVHFSVVTTEQDITIKFDHLWTTNAALGELPLGGSPGSRVRINRFVEGGFNSNQRVYIMAHELGHTIGMRHTDSQDGVHVEGTEATDDYSVFNTKVGSWNGFSSGDVIALSSMYPQD